METFELDLFLYEFDSEETTASSIALMEAPPDFLAALLDAYIRYN